MDGMSSGPETVISLGGHAQKDLIQSNSDNVNTKFSEITVPFCVGDVLIQHITTGNRRRVQISNSVSNNLFKDNKCHSARIRSTHRVSRKDILQENSNPVRPRYKSVSYLEQFRGKFYGSSKTTSSIISNGGSDLEEQSSCMSYCSYVPETISLTSESEYYVNLMKNTENKDITVNKVEAAQFPASASLSKQQKVNRLNKEKTIILSKIKDARLINERKELDKKRALEKQESYGNEVDRKNRIKITRQKEKEKLAKLMSKEEGYYQATKNVTETPNYSHIDLPPFSLNEMPAKDNQPKIKPKKKMCKTLKSEKIKIKPDDNSNLRILQLRHESDKNLVDSMKRLVLKT